MVRRRQTQPHSRSSSNGVSRRTGIMQQSSLSAGSMIKPHHSENLDDETKLAKRHLTKEMWQLVSIAVKRMADELVSISNNQQVAVTTRPAPQEPIPMVENRQMVPTEMAITPVAPPPLPQLKFNPMTSDTGAGDVEPVVAVNELAKKRTLPIQMLEPSAQTKKKAISNNATRRSAKSSNNKHQPQSLKSSSKKTNAKGTTQRLRNGNKIK